MKHAALIALFLPAAAPAVEPPRDPRVPPAIEKGVAYLKGQHQAGHGGGAHNVGLDALVGLALLEGGVKPTDAAIINITRNIRSNAPAERETYNVALSIIFLDRLNDSSDQAMIQVLGCRLLVGQNPQGGWGYQTYDPIAAADIARIQQTVMPRDIGLVRSRPQPDPNEAPPPPPKLHPEAERIAAAYRRGARLTTSGSDDNSNTQFAMVGLWVSQRRGVPAGKAFERVDTRFQRSQSPSDYGWSYNVSGNSSPSMTCAGLLGLAFATARDEARNANLKFADDPNFNAAKPKDDDPFFNPPTGNTGGNDPDAANADEPDPEEVKKNPVREAAIARALTALGGLLKNNRGMAGLGGGSWGGVDDLYFIWSLERVAVGFGLETIGDVDWYRWGLDKILPAQQMDGGWQGNYDKSAVTSFAILFLCRSNFVSDLTRNVRGKVKDPGAAELRGSRNGLSAGGTREAVRGPGSTGGGDAGGPGAPGLSAVVGATTADQISDNLVNATDKEWALRLRLARDNKGSQYTGGLVKAIPLLDAKRGFQAQTALAERLARMTTDSLRPMITHRDPELRRAAVLAVGMKDDKVLTRDLIDRTRDIEDAVCRAARAALRAMTEQDFGPPARASDDQKEKAFEQWVAWFATSGRGR